MGYNSEIVMTMTVFLFFYPIFLNSKVVKQCFQQVSFSCTVSSSDQAIRECRSFTDKPIYCNNDCCLEKDTNTLLSGTQNVELHCSNCEKIAIENIEYNLPVDSKIRHQILNICSSHSPISCTEDETCKSQKCCTHCCGYEHNPKCIEKYTNSTLFSICNGKTGICKLPVPRKQITSCWIDSKQVCDKSQPTDYSLCYPAWVEVYYQCVKLSK